jgi:AraC-like DNA-binding protein
MPLDSPKFAKYLTVTARDTQWGITCTTVGMTKIPSQACYPPDPGEHPAKYLYKWEMGRIFDEYQLVYITRGQGTFKTEGERTWRIEAGNLLMLFPNVWHWYAPDRQTGWDEYWVGFKGIYPDHLVENGFFTPGQPVMDIGLHDSLLALYMEIIDSARFEAPGYQQILGSLILHLLAHLSTLAAQHGTDSVNERTVQKAKFLLADNVTTHLDIGWLSRSLGLGYSRFRQIFKKCTGVSPYQYFLDLKIARAKELLEQGQFTVKEIAYMLSFDDPYYFSHLFKKKTGLPPSEWH